MVKNSIQPGASVFHVSGLNRVTSCIVADNPRRWGEGYIELQREDGSTFSADEHRCFTDEPAARSAAASQDICREMGIQC